MDEHEQSGPPSPPPSAPDVTTTGRHAALPSLPQLPLPEATDERALRIALQVRTGLGRPPDASGFAGSGLWAYCAGMNAKLDRVLDWTRAADASAERRLSVGARIGWEVARVLIPAAVIALLAWLGGFIRHP